MINPETGIMVPELVVQKNRLAVRKPMGIVAVREAIAATFRMADEYARTHQELIGYNIDEWPSDLQIAHRDKDTGELTKFGIYVDTEKVHSLEAVIHRGTRAGGGRIKFDNYTLSRGEHDEAGLRHLTNGGYETQLIKRDEADEYVFAKGIGPKRQERSMKVIQIMQERIHRLQEGE